MFQEEQAFDKRIIIIIIIIIIMAFYLFRIRPIPQLKDSFTP